MDEFLESVPGAPVESMPQAVETVTVADVYEAVNGLYHVNLFGSFLICGTLVGCALLRRFGQ